MRIAFAVLALVLLAGTFYLGVKVGARENWLAMSQYRAAILAADLRMIEKGRTDELKSSLEIHLNSELALYSAALDSNWTRLFPEAQPTHAIVSAANYRASHDFTDPDLGDPKNHTPDAPADFIAQLVEDQKDNQHRVQRVVAAFAEK